MLIFANKKSSKRRKEKSMATMATTPMAEITLHINDISLLNDIKRAVKMIRGVDSITVKKKLRNSLPTNVLKPTSRQEECIHTTNWTI